MVDGAWVNLSVVSAQSLDGPIHPRIYRRARPLARLLLDPGIARDLDSRSVPTARRCARLACDLHPKKTHAQAIKRVERLSRELDAPEVAVQLTFLVLLRRRCIMRPLAKRNDALGTRPTQLWVCSIEKRTTFGS